MIRISGRFVKPDELFTGITDQVHRDILKQMDGYRDIYEFPSVPLLQFELLFRTNTMKAARELDESNVKFTTFAYSFCNKDYWERLDNGGFLIKPNISPSTAILDILKNGSLYAFECSTAIAIVLYIATLYSIGNRKFDLLFQRLYLMDWQFDEDLPVYQKFGNDYLPGDVLHFNNPDFSPKEAHWRAENTVYFGGDQYYGHGVGIRNAQTIIDFLNKKRKPNPQHSAYLMHMISRVYYPYLASV